MLCGIINEVGKIQSLSSEQEIKKYLKSIERKVEYINYGELEDSRGKGQQEFSKFKAELTSKELLTDDG